MAKEDLGTLSIGISADASQLKAELRSIEAIVKGFKVPEKTIPIRIGVPTEAQIQKVQRVIDATIKKAVDPKNGLGIKLAPTLTVTGASATAFRGEIISKMGVVPIKVTADIDGNAFKTSILKELGVVDIPLTWHWAGEPPPGGAGGGGAPTGGGGGPRPTNPARDAVVAAGGLPNREPTGTHVPIPTPGTKTTTPKVTAAKPAAQAPVQAQVAAPVLEFHCPVCAARGQEQSFTTAAGLTKHAKTAHPVASPEQSAKIVQAAQAPKVAQAAAPVTAGNIKEFAPEYAKYRIMPTPDADRAARPVPPTPPQLNPRLITKTKIDPTTRERINHAIELLNDGDPAGLTELLSVGVVLKPGEVGEFRAKQRSGAAKELKLDAGLKAKISSALKVQDKGPKDSLASRSTFHGKALSLAGATGVSSAQNAANAELRHWMNEAVKQENIRAYKGDPIVQAIKARAAELGGGERGFIGAVLPEIQSQLETAIVAARAGQPDEARAAVKEILGRVYSANPKLARGLFQDIAPLNADINPATGARGGRGDKLGREHLAKEKLPASRINFKTGEYQEMGSEEFGAEAAVATARSLLGELVVGEIPQADVARKEAGKLAYQARNANAESGKAVPRSAEERANAEAKIQGELQKRTEIEGLVAKPPSGRQFLTSLPGQKRKQGKYGYDIDVANRLQRARPDLSVDTILDMMKKKGYRGLAGGGLLGRIAAAEAKKKAEGKYIVGENHDEAFLGKSGKAEILPYPAHEWQAPEEGTVTPFVPVWLRNLKAKDMTGKAGGGLVHLAGGAKRLRYPAGSPGGVGGQYISDDPVKAALGAAQSDPVSAQAAEQYKALTAELKEVTKAFKAASAAGKARPETSSNGTGPALGPIERVGARLGAIETIQDVHAQNLATRSALSETQQQLPVRSLAPAFGQIAATLFGGRGEALARLAKARDLSQQAGVATQFWLGEQKKVNELQAKIDLEPEGKGREKLIKLLMQQTKATEDAKKPAVDLSNEAQAAAKAADSLGLKLRVLTANTIGIIGGTLAFGATLGIAQAALGGVAQILTPIIERMSGFAATSAGLTTALAEQSKAAGGDTRGIIALATAQTGLSGATAATVNPLLEQRVATEAGNKGLEDQLNLVHTFEEGRRQGGQQGLAATTGGLFGTSIGGTASTQEIIKNELSAPETFLFNDQKDLRNKALAAKAAGQSTFQEGIPFVSQYNVNVEEVLKKTGDAEQVLADRLTTFNDDLAKGGEGALKFRVAVNAAEANKSGAAAKAAGFTELGALATGPTSVILVDQNNQPVLDRKTFQAGLTAVNTAAQTPDVEGLLNQLTSRILPAQIAAQEAEAQFQLQSAIPAQRGLEAATAPPLPFGTGFTQVTDQSQLGPPTPGGTTPAGFGGFSAVDPSATASFDRYKSVATAALDAVAAKAAEGKQALLDMGVPPETLAKMEELGVTARSIQVGLSNRAAAVAAVEYNHQVYILNRNLQDAIALTGHQSQAVGKLGRLERENFELGKKQQALQMQSQAIGLALSQRQINFQRALAGFQSPGETAEERAARIAEAEAEARVAQRQLDIQKELFGLGKKQFVVGVQIFDETARRQVADLQFALADLGRTHQLQIDNTAGMQAIAAIRAQQAALNQEIGVSLDKAAKLAASKISTALDISVKTGVAFGEILRTVGTAYTSEIVRFVNAIMNPVTGSTRSPTNDHGHAAGIVGDTSGTTRLTVGEAGTEHVAVLRSPRSLELKALSGIAPAAAGGTTVIVDVHDNKIEEGTMDSLVAKISAAVELSMNRKTSLLGFRTS